jgi:hypothetical protein
MIFTPKGDTMRRAVLAGAVSLGLAWSGLQPRVASAQAIQGMIRFTVHDEEGKTTEITQLSRPGKTSFMAAQSGKAGGGMIVDSTAGTMTVINGEEKTYTVINLAMMQQMMQGMAGMARGMQGMNHRGDSTAEAGARKGTITPTGRSEVVAGVTCQVYAYDGTNDGKHVTGEVCLARGAGLMVSGSMNMPGMFGMQQRQSMQQRLQEWGPLGTMLAQGYGLLKATNYENGALRGTIEVTALQRGPAPEAAFQPPAGFTEKPMGDMLGGGRRH